MFYVMLLLNIIPHKFICSPLRVPPDTYTPYEAPRRPETKMAVFTVSARRYTSHPCPPASQVYSINYGDHLV